MKKLAEYDSAYREGLAAFEAFRRLDFEPDDIWVGFGTVLGYGEDILYVQVRQATKTFVLSVAQIRGAAPEMVYATWLEIAELWNVAPEAERQEVWENSVIRKHGAELMISLARRGFVLPEMMADPSALPS